MYTYIYMNKIINSYFTVYLYAVYSFASIPSPSRTYIKACLHAAGRLKPVTYKWHLILHFRIGDILFYNLENV